MSLASHSVLTAYHLLGGALGIAFHTAVAMHAMPFLWGGGETALNVESADCHDVNIAFIVHSSCQWFNYQLTKLLAI